MPGPKAPPVYLGESERQELLALIRAHKTPQHFSFRAQIIPSCKFFGDSVRLCGSLLREPQLLPLLIEFDYF
jgi:hypothetical protein